MIEQVDAVVYMRDRKLVAFVCPRDVETDRNVLIALCAQCFMPYPAH